MKTVKIAVGTLTFASAYLQTWTGVQEESLKQLQVAISKLGSPIGWLIVLLLLVFGSKILKRLDAFESLANLGKLYELVKDLPSASGQPTTENDVPPVQGTRDSQLLHEPAPVIRPERQEASKELQVHSES